MIGSPQQLAEVLFVKLGLSRKRRGKTGFSTDARVLQAIRSEHEIIPKIERFRELTKLVQTYLDALPAYIAADGRIHTTSCRSTPPPAGSPRSTRTYRTSRSAPRPGANPGLLHRRARQRAAQRRLLAGRAARARAHRGRGRAARDLQARRGRAHGDRERRLRAPARAAGRRHALEGQDGQLRDRLRPQRLRARRSPPDRPARGSRSSSPATSRASRRRAVHEGCGRPC